MKTNLMKKAVAVTLSVAMACSASMIASPTTASAAGKVAAKTTFKTLKIGEKHTLKLVNSSGWKITKATSKDKTIANPYFTSKSKGYVKVKGKSEGRTTVVVKLKNTKTKATTNAKCRYKVEAPTSNSGDTENPPSTTVDTDATVNTQADLDAALKNKDITKITINGGESFTIVAGDYKLKDLIIDASQAEIVNSGSFKSIEIKAIKDNTFTEKGTDNMITVSAKTPCRIVVDENAVVAGIFFNTANKGVRLEANGTIDRVTISAKLEITISGTKKVSVTIEKNATETQLTASTPVEVETKAANTEIKLEEGAADSKITMTDETASISSLVNKTGKDVTVVKNNGDTQLVKTGDSPVKIEATANTTNPGGTTTTTTPGTSSSTNKAENKNTVIVTDVLPVTDNASVSTSKITSGEAVIVSVSAISFEIKGVKLQTPAAYEFIKSVESNGSTAQDLSWTSASENSNGNVTVTLNDLSLPEKNGTVTVTLKFRAQETATLKAGVVSPEVKITITYSYVEKDKKYNVTAEKVTTPAAGSQD